MMHGVHMWHAYYYARHNYTCIYAFWSYVSTCIVHVYVYATGVGPM